MLGILPNKQENKVMSILISDVKNTPIAKLFSWVSTGNVYIMVDTTFNKGAVVEFNYNTQRQAFTVKNANTPKGFVSPTFDVDTKAPDLGINKVIDKAAQWVGEITEKHRIRQIVLEMKRNGEI